MGNRSKKKAVKVKKALHDARRQQMKHFKRPGQYKDNLGNQVMPNELVFPILRRLDNGEFRTIGTGFFVHPAGGFVTAKHCLYNGDTYDDKCYAVHTISHGEHQLRKIQYFEPHPTADLGMGMLRGQLRSGITGELILKASFPMSIIKIEIDEPIATIAYPRMKIVNGTGFFRCDRFEGKVVDHFQNGTAWLKGECYQTNMLIKSGSSGGPVLRGNHIIGVNSTSFGVADTEEPISFITPISKVLDLQLKDSDGVITSVLELADSGHLPLIRS